MLDNKNYFNTCINVIRQKRTSDLKWKTNALHPIDCYVKIFSLVLDRKLETRLTSTRSKSRTFSRENIPYYIYIITKMPKV